MVLGKKNFLFLGASFISALLETKAGCFKYLLKKKSSFLCVIGKFHCDSTAVLKMSVGSSSFFVKEKKKKKNCQCVLEATHFSQRLNPW